MKEAAPIGAPLTIHREPHPCCGRRQKREAKFAKLLTFNDLANLLVGVPGQQCVKIDQILLNSNVCKILIFSFL
jgi:hypothetical protein